MEVNLLTQENIEAITELYADVPQDVAEWNNDVFATVKDVVVEPFITQANDSIAHSTALTNRVVDVLTISDAVEDRPVRRHENIDIGALGADLMNSNNVLSLCSTAYAQLESIGLKVQAAIKAGQVDLDQGSALLQNIIDLGTQYNAAVRHLWTTHRWLMFYPTAVQRELDDLTEDGLVLFNRFSGNDNLLSAETLQDDLEILKRYQEIMDRMVDRAYNTGSVSERNALWGRKNQAREIERAILNKLNERIKNWCSDLVNLANKPDLNEDDFENATTMLSNIGDVFGYYSALLAGIHNQLTEYDANTLIRNKQAIDADAMQTAVIHGILVVQGLVNCVNNFHNKVQEMGRTGVLNGNSNFNECVDKCNFAKDAVCKLDNDFTKAWLAFSYSPLSTQRELDHFIDNEKEIVVNAGKFCGNIKMGSYQQLSEFAQYREALFDQSLQEYSKDFLKMFEVLALADIARCQKIVASSGLDNVGDQFAMICDAKEYIEALHAQAVAVAALDEEDQFVKESEGRVEEIQKQYNQLYARIKAATRPVAGGMDANGVKKLFSDHRRLQDVSGYKNNCFFNSVMLQRGYTLKDQDKPELVDPLREVARIDEEGNSWMAKEECLQKVATYLQRPMVLLSDQNRDGQQSLRITLACPLDANMLQEIVPGEFDLSITEDHLRNNSTVLNILTSRTDAALPVEYNNQAVRIAYALNRWDADINVIRRNLQNMTVRDALVCLLQNQGVIVLYLNGSVMSADSGQSLYYGHYQSYLTKEHFQQVKAQLESAQVPPTKRQCK